MASLTPPVNKTAAEKAIMRCTADICNKIQFDHIKPYAVSANILDHTHVDVIDELRGNTNKMMQFLRLLGQTDITQTFVLLIDYILPQGTTAGKECKNLLLNEYRKQLERGM